jgi:hypothetical protein
VSVYTPPADACTRRLLVRNCVQAGVSHTYPQHEHFK